MNLSWRNGWLYNSFLQPLDEIEAFCAISFTNIFLQRKLRSSDQSLIIFRNWFLSRKKFCTQKSWNKWEQLPKETLVKKNNCATLTLTLLLRLWEEALSTTEPAPLISVPLMTWEQNSNTVGLRSTEEVLMENVLKIWHARLRKSVHHLKDKVWSNMSQIFFSEKAFARTL